MIWNVCLWGAICVAALSVWAAVKHGGKSDARLKPLYLVIGGFYIATFLLELPALGGVAKD